MDLYPWSFDSIHPHCHDDMIIFLKEFLIIWAIARYRAPPRRVKKKTGSSGTSPIYILLLLFSISARLYSIWYCASVNSIQDR
jgi:hypothetical protein